MLRLLKKDEINKAIASDKSKEITEGLKISRRVDALRELQAKEEESLEKYRSKTLSAIAEEINSKIAERDALSEEILVMKKDLSKETTLTRKERQNLEKLKESLAQKESELRKKEEEINLKEIDIAIALKNAKGDAERARTHKEAANELHRQAEEEEHNARASLQNAHKVEERVVEFKDKTEMELFLREQSIAQKEKELKIQEESNLQTKKELGQEKIRLADQRATLERELNRIKQNRL